MRRGTLTERERATADSCARGLLLGVEALLDAAAGLGVPTARWTSPAIGIPLLGGLVAYLALALRRAHGDGWPAALVRATVVGFVFGGGWLFYRAVTLAPALLRQAPAPRVSRADAARRPRRRRAARWRPA